MNRELGTASSNAPLADQAVRRPARLWFLEHPDEAQLPLVRRLDREARRRDCGFDDRIGPERHPDENGTAEERGFLASILMTPDDSTARLVYADYLAERGEELRAEFIRADGDAIWVAFCKVWQGFQDELSRTTGLRPRGWGYRLKAHGVPYLEFSARGPEAGHRTRWTLTCFFFRGFVELVRCPAVGWEQVAGALTCAHPIREVRLTDVPNAESQDRRNKCALEWPRIEFKFARPRR
jgi:uncharacterized protein (TIGR02996 family)